MTENKSSRTELLAMKCLCHCIIGPTFIIFNNTTPKTRMIWITKRLVRLFPLLILAHGDLFGQTTEINNFKIEESEIIWQNSFETSLTFDQLREKIKDSGLIGNLEIGENKITGDLKDVEADIVGAGYTRMTAPIYVSRSYFTAFTIIEYKEGKYRITLKRIVLTQKFTDPLTKQGQKTTIETFAIKNGKTGITNAFKKSPSEILNYTFLNKLGFKSGEKKDEW